MTTHSNNYYQLCAYVAQYYAIQQFDTFNNILYNNERLWIIIIRIFETRHIVVLWKFGTSLGRRFAVLQTENATQRVFSFTIDVTASLQGCHMTDFRFHVWTSRCWYETLADQLFTDNSCGRLRSAVRRVVDVFRLAWHVCLRWHTFGPSWPKPFYLSLKHANILQQYCCKNTI